MLIYEKDNKLNISFENNMEDTDIEIGKDEVKIGEATISENNVLPVPEEGDAGKVPTVQEDGSYALANAGGGGAFIIHNNNGTLDKTYAEIVEASATQVCIVVSASNSQRSFFRYLIEYAPTTAGKEDPTIVGYTIMAADDAGLRRWTTPTASVNDYPVIEEIG